MSPCSLINHLSYREQHTDIYTNWEIRGFHTVHTSPDDDLIVNSFMLSDGKDAPPHPSSKGTGGVKADGKVLQAPV